MQAEPITDFSREEKLKCLMREIALRNRVYAGLVTRRKLTQQQAEREIAIMLAIARDYGGHGDTT